MQEQIYWAKTPSCPVCGEELTLTGKKISYKNNTTNEIVFVKNIKWCNSCKLKFIAYGNEREISKSSIFNSNFTYKDEFGYVSCKYIDAGSNQIKKIQEREKQLEEYKKRRAERLAAKCLQYAQSQEYWAKKREQEAERTRKERQERDERIRIEREQKAERERLLRIEQEKEQLRREEELKKEECRVQSEPYIHLYENYTDFDKLIGNYITVSEEVYTFIKENHKPGVKPLKEAIDDPDIQVSLRKSIADYIVKCRNKVLESKAAGINSFFQACYCADGKPFLLDKEQALAVSDDADSVLVTARAGSGKTRVIAAKILYLIDYCHITSSSILSLTFNKIVREEISTRINHDIRRKSSNADRLFDISNTFHSYAYAVCPGHDILSNDKSKYIRRLIEQMKRDDLTFRERVYNAFRMENFTVDKGLFRSPEEYYQYIRNGTYFTLNGEIVKSLGEKWIADFLFENGIKYQYEKQYYPQSINESTLRCTEKAKNRITRFLNENCRITEEKKKVRNFTAPDFFLPDYNLIWEHWGISEKDTEQEKENFGRIFTQSWYDYKEHKVWKQKFWSVKWSNYLVNAKPAINDICSVEGLLETDVSWLKDGREIFERRLSELLSQNNIQKNVKEKNKLIEEVWLKQNTRFTTMMNSFIDKFQQTFPDHTVEEVRKITEKMHLRGNVAEFTSIGFDVLEKYEETLKMREKPVLLKEFNSKDCDFNQLLQMSTEKIERGEYDQEICKLKYLLIDEYQDFSQLFFQFIKAIRSRNEKIKIFCVGDSWQAINRFMGADTTYYDRFEKFFANSSIRAISKNYRSKGKLVLSSSDFMSRNHFDGLPASPSNYEQADVLITDIQGVHVEYRSEEAKFQEDEKYRTMLGEICQDKTMWKYMRYLAECVVEEIKSGAQDVMVLSRTNKIKGYYDKSSIEEALKKYLKNDLKYTDDVLGKISFKTMHGSKGSEADTVILIEANKGRIPLIHPDNELFTIFGVSPEDVLDDEIKLFYVAVTRAKKRLRIAYDEQMSDYVVKYKNSCWEADKWIRAYNSL